VTDVVVSLEYWYYRANASTMGTARNFSQYSVLKIFYKVTSAVTCWLGGLGLCDDLLYRNLLILNRGCGSYLKV